MFPFYFVSSSLEISLISFSWCNCFCSVAVLISRQLFFLYYLEIYSVYRFDAFLLWWWLFLSYEVLNDDTIDLCFSLLLSLFDTTAATIRFVYNTHRTTPHHTKNVCCSFACFRLCFYYTFHFDSVYFLNVSFVDWNEMEIWKMQLNNGKRGQRRRWQQWTTIIHILFTRVSYIFHWILFGVPCKWMHAKHAHPHLLWQPQRLTHTVWSIF